MNTMIIAEHKPIETGVVFTNPMATTGLGPQAYIVGLCSYKLVYKPYEYYSYKYQVP